MRLRASSAASLWRAGRTPTRDFYNVPMVKYATRACSHFVLMGLYAYTLVATSGSVHLTELITNSAPHPTMPPLEPVEVVFFVFAVGQALDQIYARLVSAAQGASGTIQFASLSLLSDTIVVGSMLARLLSIAIPLPASDDELRIAAICYQVYVVSLSWAVVLVFTV